MTVTLRYSLSSIYGDKYKVVKETGLTKKAIYYYEEAGLITPQKDENNSYRIYKKDVTGKILAGSASISDSVKNDIKAKSAEYEKPRDIKSS